MNIINYEQIESDKAKKILFDIFSLRISELCLKSLEKGLYKKIGFLVLPYPPLKIVEFSIPVLGLTPNDELLVEISVRMIMSSRKGMEAKEFFDKHIIVIFTDGYYFYFRVEEIGVNNPMDDKWYQIFLTKEEMN